MLDKARERWKYKQVVREGGRGVNQMVSSWKSAEKVLKNLKKVLDKGETRW